MTNTDIDITIPPAALEAAAKEIADANGWRDEQGVRVCREVARAACLAMLKNWPGMRVSRLFPPNVLHVVLPLPQEPTND